MRRPYPASLSDQVIAHADSILKSILGGAQPGTRPSPAGGNEPALDRGARQAAARLMRVNHTGEVCAQALYRGQLLTARHPKNRKRLAAAAGEELDHLYWCEQGLRALDGHLSALNPFFYLGSYCIGATVGLFGDRVSLGFIAATERQVVRHLQDHLERLPEEDVGSRAILEQMKTDEAAHATAAEGAGGITLGPRIEAVMTAVGKLMTATAYRV